MSLSNGGLFRSGQMSQESGCTGFPPNLSSSSMARAKQSANSDYARAAKAVAFLRTHSHDRPTLAQAAAAVGLSPSHFQKLFKRWVGISPKKYLQSLALTEAQRQLRDGQSVLDSAFNAGLSGPGRLHDLFVTFQGMTPAEYRDRGSGLSIGYGIHDSPFGQCLLGFTERGICWLSFPSGAKPAALAPLKNTWPGARFYPASDETGRVVKTIFPGAGSLPQAPLSVLVQGTEFQLQVWRALLGIPLGATATYADVAKQIRKPRAVRAVGSAVGRNTVSFLIPCHRVIRSNGEVGDYRWESSRKEIMLEWEQIHLLPT